MLALPYKQVDKKKKKSAWGGLRGVCVFRSFKKIYIYIYIYIDIANNILLIHCNKGGRGENILRNIVGNRGWLRGGYCTIMCNNAPFPRRRRFFFRHLNSQSTIHPKPDPDPPKTP